MRKLTVLFVLITIVGITFITGCDGSKSDPLYGVTIAGDGNGGAFLLYQGGGSGDVAVRKLSASGEREWETVIDSPDLDPAVYASLDIVGGGNGGVFVAWPDGSEEQMRPVRNLARLHANGDIAWQRDFIYFREMAADGDGGALLAFDRSMGIDTGSGTGGISLVKVDANGDYPWGIQGTGIVTNEYYDNSTHVISDGWGGATVIWEERERPAGLAVGEPGMTYRVMALHIDADGNKSADNAVKLYETPENVSLDSLQAAPDGLGGAVLSWFHVTEDPQAEPGHRQTWDVAVQRVNERGQAAWGPNPVTLDITEAAPDSHPMQPELCGDGSGGAVVIWRDTRHDNTSEASIYAQRLDRDGKQLWTAGGIKVSSTSLNPYPDIVAAGAGSAFISYSYESDGQVLHIQKLDGSGAAWAENGVTVTDSGFFRPSLVTDDRGGAIIAWNTGDRADKPGDTFIQRFDGNGNPLWGENGIDLRQMTVDTQKSNIAAASTLTTSAAATSSPWPGVPAYCEPSGEVDAPVTGRFAAGFQTGDGPELQWDTSANGTSVSLLSSSYKEGAAWFLFRAEVSGRTDLPFYVQADGTPKTTGIVRVLVRGTLTKEETARVIEIALATPRSMEWLKGKTDYRVSGIDWYAIPDAGGGWSIVDSPSAATWLPDPYKDEEISFYPGVTISRGAGTIYQMQTAVDLGTGQVVMEMGPYPSLSSPDRFKDMLP